MERLIFQTLKENNNLLHVSMYHKRFYFRKSFEEQRYTENINIGALR